MSNSGYHLIRNLLAQIKVDLERIYQEEPPLNEMGNRVDLSRYC